MVTIAPVKQQIISSTVSYKKKAENSKNQKEMVRIKTTITQMRFHHGFINVGLFCLSTGKDRMKEWKMSLEETFPTTVYIEKKWSNYSIVI